MTHYLGYEKGQAPPRDEDQKPKNHRNGTSKKTLLSEDGKLEIEVPRDRAGEFDPQFIRKGQRRFGGFDQKIIAMYAQGMTVEEQTRNGIFCTPSVNPPRKQRMSLRQRSVNYAKSFLRAFTREERYPTCFKFRFVSSPHKAPNLIGVRTGDLNKRVSTFLSGYMTMGESGMAGMGNMGMKVPRNSLPMVGMQGKHDYIDMGGMFTVVKVRENLTSYDDPGWYENPPGTLASLASNDEMQRDLGQIPDAKPMDKNMKMDDMNMDNMDMKHGG
jgi:Transposase, Mutator family